MENPSRTRPLAQSTLSNLEYYRRRRTISPRVRHGIKLYMSGAAKTQKEAAATVGVSPAAIGQTIKHSPLGRDYAESLDQEIRRRVVDLSAVIEGLGERAVARIAKLMDGAGKEEVQLKAAQDLLDRNPATSKTRRVAIESLSLTGRDVETLVKAMTTGAELKSKFAEAAIGDYTPADNGDPSNAIRTAESQGRIQSSEQVHG